LTRSRDGSTGTATFRFQNPDVLSFNDVWENGLITGLWMKDDEGLLMTRDLDVAFERGSPTAMTAILVLKSTAEWDRFMRFMQRYAESNSLEFYFKTRLRAAQYHTRSHASGPPRALWKSREVE
jgi:photosystem II protein